MFWELFGFWHHSQYRWFHVVLLSMFPNKFPPSLQLCFQCIINMFPIAITIYPFTFAQKVLLLYNLHIYLGHREKITIIRFRECSKYEYFVWRWVNNQSDPSHRKGEKSWTLGCVYPPQLIIVTYLPAFFSHFKDIQFSNVMYVRLYLLLLFLFRKKMKRQKT